MVEYKKKEKIKFFPLRILVPNILTIAGLCFGLTAIRYALDNQFGSAVLFMLLAGIIDGLDGRVARLLKGDTKFGAELDSLSDIVNFGIAPALTLYFWSLRDLGQAGWVILLIFVVCSALRLARFNTDFDDSDKPEWTVNYFIGVPTPAGAGIALLPLVFSFLNFDFIMLYKSLLSFGFVTFSSILMISKVPTFSFKKMKVRRDLVLLTLLSISLLMTALLYFTWEFLSIIGGLYLLSIPVSFYLSKKDERKYEKFSVVKENDDFQEKIM